MARSKPGNLHPVRNIDEANDAIREIGELKRIVTDIAKRPFGGVIPERRPGSDEQPAGLEKICAWREEHEEKEATDGI